MQTDSKCNLPKCIIPWDVELGSVSMWSACQNQLDVLGENEGSSRWRQGGILVFAAACVRLVHVCIFLAVAAPQARALRRGTAAAQLLHSFALMCRASQFKYYSLVKNFFLLDLKTEFTFFCLAGQLCADFVTAASIRLTFQFCVSCYSFFSFSYSSPLTCSNSLAFCLFHVLWAQFLVWRWDNLNYFTEWRHEFWNDTTIQILNTCLLLLL